jgi:hypothetical protein
MKRFIVFSLFFLTLISTTGVYAEETIRPERGIVALKTDYLAFTDSDLKKFGPEDGLYVGLEAYAKMSTNLYLGGEIGYFQRDGCGCMVISGADNNPVRCDVESELTLIPVEVNMKYNVGRLTEKGMIMLGAGVSFNYADMETSTTGFSTDEDDWLLGAQVSFDIHFDFERFFLGINGKYQISEKMEFNEIDTDVHIDNWRIGGQIGMRF